jgi:hypothetical protein
MVLKMPDTGSNLAISRYSSGRPSKSIGPNDEKSSLLNGI